MICKLSIYTDLMKANKSVKWRVFSDLSTPYLICLDACKDKLVDLGKDYIGRYIPIDYSSNSYSIIATFDTEEECKNFIENTQPLGNFIKDKHISNILKKPEYEVIKEDAEIEKQYTIDETMYFYTMDTKSNKYNLNRLSLSVIDRCKEASAEIDLDNIIDTTKIDIIMKFMKSSKISTKRLAEISDVSYNKLRSALDGGTELDIKSYNRVCKALDIPKETLSKYSSNSREYRSFGETVRHYRVLRGMSPKEFCDACLIDMNDLYRIEDDNKEVNKVLRSHIIKTLGIPKSELEPKKKKKSPIVNKDDLENFNFKENILSRMYTENLSIEDLSKITDIPVYVIEAFLDRALMPSDDLLDRVSKALRIDRDTLERIFNYGLGNSRII